MADPTSGAAIIALTTTGISLLGVATGLHPDLLLAGLSGGFWALCYADPLPGWRRVAITAVAAVIAGYFTPLVVAVVKVGAWLPPDLTQDVVRLPAAATIGFLAHKIIGPAFVRLGAKLTENAAK